MHSPNEELILIEKKKSFQYDSQYQDILYLADYACEFEN